MWFASTLKTGMTSGGRVAKSTPIARGVTSPNHLETTRTVTELRALRETAPKGLPEPVVNSSGQNHQTTCRGARKQIRGKGPLKKARRCRETRRPSRRGAPATRSSSPRAPSESTAGAPPDVNPEPKRAARWHPHTGHSVRQTDGIPRGSSQVGCDQDSKSGRTTAQIWKCPQRVL